MVRDTRLPVDVRWMCLVVLTDYAENHKATEQENAYLRAENTILRSVSPFQQSTWLPPPLQTNANAMKSQISQDTLRRILDTTPVDLDDIAFITNRKLQFPPGERLLTEQIVITGLFRDWISSPSSSRLLVQWDSNLPRIIAGISPLSVFGMTIAQLLRAKSRFISLVWFCGRHLDVVESDRNVGGQSMLVSLIDQLLRQHVFNAQHLPQDIDIENLVHKSTHSLLRLLKWLIGQLPESVTLFFIIDGIVLYEREEFWEEAQHGLSAILTFCNGSSTSADVKVLYTSAPGAGVVKVAFQGDNLILHMHQLPRLPWAPNEDRMMRGVSGDVGESNFGWRHEPA